MKATNLNLNIEYDEYTTDLNRLCELLTSALEPWRISFKPGVKLGKFTWSAGGWTLDPENKLAESHIHTFVGPKCVDCGTSLAEVTGANAPLTGPSNP